MNINRHNYEAFLLDYDEGNLTREEREKVEAFMYANLDLASSVNFFDDMIQQGVQEKVLKKELLKDINQKTVSVKNLDEFIIADLEGELSLKNSEKLERFLENHPSHRKDYILYSKTFLKPSTSTFFPNKRELIKTSEKTRVRKIYPWLALAGSLLLLLGFYFLYSRSSRDHEIKTGVAINDVTHPAHVNPVTKIPAIKAENEKRDNEFSRPEMNKEKPRAAIKRENNQDEKSSREENKINAPAIRTKENEAMSPLQGFEFHVIAVNAPAEKLHPVHMYYLNPDDAAKPVTAYKTIPMFLLAKFNDLLFPRSDEPLVGEYSPDELLWALADVGIKGVNRITDKEIALHRDISPEGKVTRFSLEAKNFEIARVKKQ